MTELTIEKVIEHYTPGTRLTSRREQSIKCPVHEERNASASLNLEKQVMFCHACGFGGGPLEIIMAREKLDREHAIEYASSVLRAGVKGLRGPAREEKRHPVSRLRQRLFD